MVIERFKNRDSKSVYERYHQKGRMLPSGLKYLGSWTESTLARCFQLMECEDISLFDEWTSHWNDLIDFEIVPVQTGAQAADSILGSKTGA
jgi:hypothetical protein